MENQIFEYSLMQTDAEGNKTFMSKGAVFLREVVNSILKDDVLYLFLKGVNKSMQIVESPQKVKITKENPSGWIRGVEKREVEEPQALLISEAEDIARWQAFVTSNNI